MTIIYPRQPGERTFSRGSARIEKYENIAANERSRINSLSFMWLVSPPFIARDLYWPIIYAIFPPRASLVKRTGTYATRERER